ncbi:MAG: accessory gene regulator B family protein [Clostridia bacterium]|nr:accessory gene regulator B family protein [Clostridia bacterium]
MNTNKAAQNLASYLASELKMPEEQQEVLAYGLELILLGLLGIAAVALGGYLVGAPLEALAALLASSLLRLPGGGWHLQSPLKCLIFTVLIFNIIGYFCKIVSQSANIHYIVLAIILSGFFSLAVSWFVAPVINPHKPLNSAKLKARLRRLAIAVALVVPLVLLFALGRWTALALAGAAGLIWQSANMCLLKVIKRKGV